MKKVWIILMMGCIFSAIALFLTHYFDAAFIVTVLGCVAWFLDFRGQAVKRRDEAINIKKTGEN